MTEVEWRTCEDPRQLLNFLKRKTSDRKLRLFACACCNLYSSNFRDESEMQALEVAERYAEGLANEAEREEACHAVFENTMDEEGNFSCTVEATAPDAFVAARGVCHFAQNLAHFGQLTTRDIIEELRPLAVLLHDVCGNPFRRFQVSPSWLCWNAGTVRRIAQALYEERAFDRMPILADALEDASCDNADILAHCRGPWPHVRGCWVVDLLLGKK
jgi:hypothetical protein